MSTTNNYNLYTEDGMSVAFQSWREQMNGTSDSNMTKIDAALTQKADKPTSFSVTLASDGWSDSVQTVADERFLSSGYVYIVSADPADFMAYTKSMIYADDVTVDGQMTFHYSKAPSENCAVTIVRMVTV